MAELTSLQLLHSQLQAVQSWSIRRPSMATAESRDPGGLLVPLEPWQSDSSRRKRSESRVVLHAMLDTAKIRPITENVYLPFTAVALTHYAVASITTWVFSTADRLLSRFSCMPKMIILITLVIATGIFTMNVGMPEVLIHGQEKASEDIVDGHDQNISDMSLFLTVASCGLLHKLLPCSCMHFDDAVCKQLSCLLGIGLAVWHWLQCLPGGAAIECCVFISYITICPFGNFVCCSPSAVPEDYDVQLKPQRAPQAALAANIPDRSKRPSPESSQIEVKELTPPYTAVEEGHSEGLQARDAGSNPVFIAAQEGDLEALQVLTDAWADAGCSQAYIAAYEGQSETLQVLIASKADMDKAKNGEDLGFRYTPAYAATRMGHSEALQVLIDARTDVDRAENGLSLAYAAAAMGHSEALQALINARADVNKAYNDECTPAYIAAYEGHLEALQVLMAARADMNKARNEGYTPSYAAAAMGHSEVLQVLIDARADVHKADKNGCTPAHFAASMGHFEALQILLGARADVVKAETGGLCIGGARDRHSTSSLLPLSTCCSHPPTQPSAGTEGKKI